LKKKHKSGFFLPFYKKCIMLVLTTKWGDEAASPTAEPPRFPAIWKKECPKNKGIRVEPPVAIAGYGTRSHLFFGYLFLKEL
jgi:hypothetical protein